MSYDVERLRRAMRSSGRDEVLDGSPVHGLAALRVVFASPAFPIDAPTLLEIEGWLRARSASRPRKGRALDAGATRRRLRRHLDRLEQHAPPRTGALVARLDRLAQTASLGLVERELLVLAGVPVFERVAELCAARSPRTELPPLVDVLAVALARAPEDVLAALAPSSLLRRAELIEVRTEEPRFCLAELARSWLVEDCDDEPLEEVLEVLPASALGLRDFVHVGLDAEILRDHLRASLDAGKATAVGVAGPPESGRTELVRAVAAELGAAVLRVRKSVEALTAADLIRLRLARDAAGARALLLLEAERGEPRAFPEKRRRRPRRFVEEEPDTSLGRLGLPMIHMLEPRGAANEAPFAFMFASEPLVEHDLLIEVPALPEPLRLRALARAAGLREGPTPRWLEHAAARGAAPSAVAKHAKLVSAIRHADSAVAARQLEHLVRREGKVQRPSPPQSALAYDPAWIRTDVPVERLLAAMRRSSRGRVLMHGEPGTGKSRLARELARRGGLEIVTRTGSELLSMWLGGTEKNLAAAFEEATRRGALLLLDEVDSFLSSRRGATRSHEVTQVNELLVQIESFDGWLVCTTNFCSGLDEAALRRFPIKVEFFPPDERQRRALFDAARAALGVPETIEERSAVDRVLSRAARLTPGDVAAVVEQAQILGGIETSLALAERLSREVSYKAGEKKKVGFG